MSIHWQWSTGGHDTGVWWPQLSCEEVQPVHVCNNRTTVHTTTDVLRGRELTFPASGKEQPEHPVLWLPWSDHGQTPLRRSPGHACIMLQLLRIFPAGHAVLPPGGDSERHSGDQGPVLFPVSPTTVATEQGLHSAIPNHASSAPMPHRHQPPWGAWWVHRTDPPLADLMHYYTSEHKVRNTHFLPSPCMLSDKLVPWWLSQPQYTTNASLALHTDPWGQQHVRHHVHLTRMIHTNRAYSLTKMHRLTKLSCRATLSPSWRLIHGSSSATRYVMASGSL